MFALLLAYQLVQLCPQDAVLGMAVQLLVGHWVGLLILHEKFQQGKSNIH